MTRLRRRRGRTGVEKAIISGEELWTRVEEDRLRGNRKSEPYLVAFRAMQEGD
jgi:hypothetical protein